MRGVTPPRRRLTPMRMHPLNRRNRIQRALAAMAPHIHQQPGNRIRIERIHMRRGLPRHFAAIRQLPRWTRPVMPNHFVFSIAQLRIRSLQRPTKLSIRSRRADINLRSRRMSVDRNLQPSRNLDCVGNIRRWLFQRAALGPPRDRSRRSQSDNQNRASKTYVHKPIVAPVLKLEGKKQGARESALRTIRSSIHYGIKTVSTT